MGSGQKLLWPEWLLGGEQRVLWPGWLVESAKHWERKKVPHLRWSQAPPLPWLRQGRRIKDVILMYDDHVCEVKMWLFWLFLKMKTQRSANVNVNVGRRFFIDSSMVPHGAAGFKCPGHLPQRHASGPDVGDGLATSLANVGRCWEVAKTCRALLLLLYVI